MAELAIKIGDKAGFLDGDIIEPFTNLRIRRVHAEHICHYRHAGFTRDGLRPAVSLLAEMMDNTRQFRFNRIGRFRVQRRNLFTRAVEEFDAPNLPQWIQARQKSSRHLIFGLPGSEFWYGGGSLFNHTTLDNVWTAIESGSPEREANYTKWPATPRELRRHLFVAVNDMTEAEAVELIAPELDNRTGEVTRRRVNQVDYRTRLELSAGDIVDVLDASKELDLRTRRQFTRGEIVETRQSLDVRVR